MNIYIYIRMRYIYIYGTWGRFAADVVFREICQHNLGVQIWVPSGNDSQFAIEHAHRNSEFSQLEWLFSTVM